MYTYPEIKLQNKQDAFCAMYHNICRSIFALCGAYEGEGVIRSAVRAAGEASGAEQLKKLTQAKACTDLSNLYRLGTDIAIDPRIRAVRALCRHRAPYGRGGDRPAHTRKRYI